VAPVAAWRETLLLPHLTAGAPADPGIASRQPRNERNASEPSFNRTVPDFNAVKLSKFHPLDPVAPIFHSL
jgi:hypothetical protein